MPVATVAVNKKDINVDASCEEEKKSPPGAPGTVLRYGPSPSTVQTRKEWGFYLEKIYRRIRIDQNAMYKTFGSRFRHITNRNEIHKLDQAAPMYDVIMQYIANGCGPKVQVDVQDIFTVKCPGDEIIALNSSYMTEIKQPFKMLLWYSTSAEEVATILSRGFKQFVTVADFERANVGKQLLLGNGFYFHDFVDRALQMESGLKRVLLLCEVELGQMCVSFRPNRYAQCAPKYFNSMQAVGRWIPNPDDLVPMENGTHIPMGKKIWNKYYDRHHQQFNDFVVYNPSQIKIKYMLNVQIVCA